MLDVGPESYSFGMLPSPDAVRRVRTWVRGGLLLEAGGSWTPEVAGEPVTDLLAAVRRHRVEELVTAQAAGLAVPAALVDELAVGRDATRHALMVQVLEVARVRALLSEAGIRSLSFKGPALAVQTTGDPAARGRGDIDLLISPDQVVNAHRVLCSHGWALRTGSEVEPGTWAWDHVLRSFNAFTYDGSTAAIDLHWRLDPTLDALPDFEEAWSRHEVVDVGGVAIPTLGRADVFGHASLHAAKDSFRWIRNLVDLHRLARDPRTWDRDSVADPLRRLEVEALAVTRFVVGLPPTVPADVLARLDRVPASRLNRAVRIQEGPAQAAVPFPGVESLRLMRYMVDASRTRRDLAHSLVSTVLPVKAVVGVRSRSAWTGVPLTLWYRVRRLRRRSVAWARREPGAGVVDPLVRTSR